MARVAQIQSEMELAFAALQQLCAPMLDKLGGPAGPQRDALGVAFGLNTGTAPDRFLVGLAALGLLSEVAEQQPLLCVIDDAQWLDHASAQALTFVARRLLAEPVALVFATREPVEEFRGLPELLVGGLHDGDAQELLSSVIKGPLDERVRDRIVAETRGNPLALLELPHGVPGVFNVSGVPGRIEDAFRRRVEVLPGATQRLMLVAALVVSEPALVWRAAERVGVGAEAVAPAADAGLLVIGERVTFRHPLVRSAVYRTASPPERRVAHQALRGATDPQADPDRWAWHRAQATLGPDEDVACELERSASRAQARGGLAAAAAFLERSAALTVDPARRAERALAAAQAKCQAGAFDATLRLLATAEAGPPDEFRRACADLLRGQIAFASSRGSDAPPLLLKAAREFEPLDPRLARETYLEALAAAIFAGHLALGGGMREVAEAARMAPPPPGPARGPDLLLDGLALMICEGYPAGAPVLRQAVSTFRGTDVSTEEELRWLLLACHAALIVWDYASWDVLSERQITLARNAGALIALPIAFNMRSSVYLFAGEFTEAASTVAQAESVTEVTGSSLAPYGPLALAVFRGREAPAAQLIQTVTDDAEHRGEGRALSLVHWGDAVLGNSLGRYEEALAAAQRASEDSPAVQFASWALVELIEAAVRSGVPDVRPAPCSGSPASPGPAGRIGCLVPRPARGRCSATAQPPRTSTARRSTASAVLACGWTWPAPIWSTASGCAGSGADAMPATSSAAPTRSSTRRRRSVCRTGTHRASRDWRAGPAARRQDARDPDRARRADRPPRQAKAPPIRRSPPSCSSAGPPSPITCGRSSPSSASARAASFLRRFPHGQAQHRRSRPRADSQRIRAPHRQSRHRQLSRHYQLLVYDYPPWRMRAGAHQT